MTSSRHGARWEPEPVVRWAARADVGRTGIAIREADVERVANELRRQFDEHVGVTRFRRNWGQAEWTLDDEDARVRVLYDTYNGVVVQVYDGDALQAEWAWCDKDERTSERLRRMAHALLEAAAVYDDLLSRA